MKLGVTALDEGVLIKGVLIMVRDSDLAVLVRLVVPYSYVGDVSGGPD